MFAIAFVLYANSMRNGFAFDDVPVILRDTRVHHVRNIPKLWTGAYWVGGRLGGYFRPLTTTSYALDYALHGRRPAGYHLVNVLLHALISALVVPLARRLGVPPPGALLAGILFAAHPIHTEAAAWITGRSDLLAALAFLVGTLFWLRYRETDRTRDLAGLAAAYGLGLLCKEHVVVFPAVPIALEAASTRFRNPEERRRLFSALLVCVATLSLDLALRMGATGRLLDRPVEPVAGLLYGEPFVVRLLTFLKILDRAVRLLIFPFRLSPDYSFNQISIPRGLELRVLTGSLITLGCAALVVRAWSVPRRFAMAVWAAATYFPVSNLLVAVPLLFAERTLYLPSVALAVIAGDWLASGPLARNVPQRRATWALILMIATLWGVRTIQRNADWRDDLALFGAAVRASPASALMRSNYGNALLLAGRPAAAIPQLQATLRILPEGEVGLKASYHLSVAYEQLGLLAQADAAIRQAIAIDPGRVEVWHQLGRILAQQGKVSAAQQAFQRESALASTGR